MILRIQKPTSEQQQLGACAGCPQALTAAAGLGCASPCDAWRRNLGLGAFDPSSIGIGAGTVAVIVGAILLWYLVQGNPARVRRRKLAAELKRHREAVARIKAEYGRFGRRTLEED